VVVALRATNRLPQPHRADGPHAVREHACFVILGLRPAFLGREQQAVEGRADLLLHAAVREEVPGELFPRELIVVLILVEGLDDVITIRPNVARHVRVITHGVCVAHRIQPADGHAFAVVGGGQELIHQLFVSAGRLVRLERGYFLGRRRQADEVEGESARQRAPIRFRREFEANCFEALLQQ